MSGSDGKALRPVSERSGLARLSRRAFFALSLPVLAFSPTGTASAQVSLEQVKAEIMRMLNGGAAFAVGHRLDTGKLRQWYAQRGYQPAWLGSRASRDKAHRLVEILAAADQEGLNPADYAVEALGAGLWASTARQLATADLALSNELLRYVRHLRTGRVPPEEVGANLEPPGAYIAGPTVLTGSQNASDIGRYLQNISPNNPVYRGLKEMLGRYLELAAGGGWPPVPPGPSLQPGASDRRVQILRKRLSVSGDLTGSATGGNTYDPALAQAVQRFQGRHGLQTDGVVGPVTVAALNIPVQARIDQIRLNMERWRWMPDDLGERYIIVNLAGFDMQVVENGRVVMAMPVVVGQPYRSTPIFSDTMTHMEFNPTWSLPPTIIEEDILPEVRKDPGYLRSRDIRVLTGWEPGSKELDPYKVKWSRLNGKDFPYLLRQDPGPKNPLGRVKFMFPNKHAIYLHDTPAKELFERTVRTFSSGCIRVERPMELALYLGAGLPGWSPQEIDSLVATKKTKEVHLPEPIPIHITYSTAWLGEDGTMNFRDDVYERDAVLARALVTGTTG